MPTIHGRHNDTTTTNRRRRRWPALAAFALAAALLTPVGAAMASDSADCYPLAADVGSIVAPSTALPSETIEAMMTPVQCSAAGTVGIDWPADADVGSIL